MHFIINFILILIGIPCKSSEINTVMDTYTSPLTCNILSSSEFPNMTTYFELETTSYNDETFQAMMSSHWTTDESQENTLSSLSMFADASSLTNSPSLGYCEDISHELPSDVYSNISYHNPFGSFRHTGPLSPGVFDDDGSFNRAPSKWTPPAKRAPMPPPHEMHVPTTTLRIQVYSYPHILDLTQSCLVHNTNNKVSSWLQSCPVPPVPVTNSTRCSKRSHTHASCLRPQKRQKVQPLSSKQHSLITKIRHAGKVLRKLGGSVINLKTIAIV